MPDDLLRNQVAIAVRGTAFKRVLEPVLLAIDGNEPVFDLNGAGVRFRLDIDYDVYQAEVDMRTPHIAVDPLEMDTTWNFHLDINFNDLYDAVASLIWLPPRCMTVPVPWPPFTEDICLDLGSASLMLPVPVSFTLWALLLPRVRIDGNKYVVYPQIDYFDPFFIDAGRINERICQAIANELPWPLSYAVDRICEISAEIFDFLQEAVGRLTLELGVKLFDVTNGWVGVQLKDVKIVEFERDKLPGTGTSASNPAIPVVLDQLAIKINSSNELEARVLVLEAP